VPLLRNTATDAAIAHSGKASATKLPSLFYRSHENEMDSTLNVVEENATVNAAINILILIGL
jgi:hypothetical protein